MNGIEQTQVYVDYSMRTQQYIKTVGKMGVQPHAVYYRENLKPMSHDRKLIKDILRLCIH